MKWIVKRFEQTAAFMKRIQWMTEIIVILGFVITVIVVTSGLLIKVPTFVEKFLDLVITMFAVIAGIPVGFHLQSRSSTSEKQERAFNGLVMLHDQLKLAIVLNDLAVAEYVADQGFAISPDIDVLRSGIESLYLIDDLETRDATTTAIRELTMLKSRHETVTALLRNGNYQGGFYKLQFDALAHKAVGTEALKAFKNDNRAETDEKLVRSFTNDGVGADCIRAISKIEQQLRKIGNQLNKFEGVEWEPFNSKRIQQVENRVPVEEWAKRERGNPTATV